MLKPSLLLLGVGALLFGAFSSSSNYSLQNYGIGSGATNNSSSTTYKLNGASGEIDGSPTTGTADTGKSGSVQAGQANVPLAPTLSNGGNTYYNKLNCIVNKGGADAADYTYAIAASTDGFATTSYVQADGTLNTTPVFRTYSAWGGAIGAFITGLSPNTTYQVKVSAMQGAFTQSAYGAVASSATANPSLTFSLSPNSLALGSLLPGSIVTSSIISIGFATNGGAGGNVYLAGQNAGLRSTVNSYTIPATSSDLSGQTQGFGVLGLSATQTSGGPFTISSPFNGSGNVVGADTTSFQPIFASTATLVGGSATASLKAKAATTTPAASDYQEVLTFVASASF